MDIPSDGLRLRAHLARPVGEGAHAGQLLVVSHGFPAAPTGAAGSGHTYPQLAARLSAEAGWSVLTFNFRGTGDSDGDFSLLGWVDDLRAVVSHAFATQDVAGVWLAGFSTGGSLSIWLAAQDHRIRGVAALAAPAGFPSWLAHPQRLVDHARDLGVIRTKGFPEDMAAWSAELGKVRPLEAVERLAPRPLLIAHGADDDLVDLADARALAGAYGEGAELRVLNGAGHRLRHDPRAVAVLLGWMERQRP